MIVKRSNNEGQYHLKRQINRYQTRILINSLTTGFFNSTVPFCLANDISKLFTVNLIVNIIAC